MSRMFVHRQQEWLQQKNRECDNKASNEDLQLDRVYGRRDQCGPSHLRRWQFRRQHYLRPITNWTGKAQRDGQDVEDLGKASQPAVCLQCELQAAVGIGSSAVKVPRWVKPQLAL